MKKQPNSKTSKTAKKTTGPPLAIRFNITMPPELLKHLDEAARKDYTTRSSIIRMAVLWYLRPAGMELNQADPDIILKALKNRQLHNSLKNLRYNPQSDD